VAYKKLKAEREPEPEEIPWRSCHGILQDQIKHDRRIAGDQCDVIIRYLSDEGSRECVGDCGKKRACLGYRQVSGKLVGKYGRKHQVKKKDKRYTVRHFQKEIHQPVKRIKRAHLRPGKKRIAEHDVRVPQK